jgi:type IV fimbrial biogenesis protein FimT
MERGWTLMEVLIACAVVATLASLAVPQFREAAANARHYHSVHAMLRSLHLARSTAVMRAQPVVVCASRDGERCSGEESWSWSSGWIVFVNGDRALPAQVDDGETILVRERPDARLRVSANRAALTYWPYARGGTTASIVFCDERGSRSARVIIISHTGRPRVSGRDASGRALRCG